MRTFDVSMPLAAGMAAFPGDPPFEALRIRSVERDGFALSRLTMGTHTGTHIDPPRHFDREGAGPDRLDLDILNGPCEVVQLPPDAAVVDASAVGSVPAGARRVLFRTSNSDRWAKSPEFFPDYVALDRSAADALLSRRVRLVGIDALSVERDPTEAYPVHRALLGGGTLILEGLWLGAVPPGRYELRCLPLRVEDGDGGPARAVLLAP